MGYASACRFVSRWRRAESGIVYSGEVPAGGSAELRLPGEEPRALGPGRWEFRVGKGQEPEKKCAKKGCKKSAKKR